MFIKFQLIIACSQICWWCI